MYLELVLNKAKKQTDNFNDMLTFWSSIQISQRIKNHGLKDALGFVMDTLEDWLEVSPELDRESPVSMNLNVVEWTHSLAVVKLKEPTDPKESEIEQMSQYIVIKWGDEGFYLTHWSGKEWVRHVPAPTDLAMYRPVSRDEMAEVLAVVVKHFRRFPLPEEILTEAREIAKAQAGDTEKPIRQLDDTVVI